MKTQVFPNIYAVSIVNGRFSRVSFGNFFSNFAHFEIQTLPSTYCFRRKSVKAIPLISMAKNKKSFNIGETV